MFLKGLYKYPHYIAVIFNVLSYFILYLYNENNKNEIIYICMAVVIMIIMNYKIIYINQLGNEKLFLIVFMLFSLGNVMISRINSSIGLQQAIWLVIGVAVFYLSDFVFSKIKFWHKSIFIYVSLGILIYLVTQLFGKTINGAKNWVEIFGYPIQMSEISKIVFLFFVASYFSSCRGCIIKIKILRKIDCSIINRIFLLTVFLLNVSFLVLQREWGGISLIFIMYFLILYVYDNNKKFYFASLMISILITVFGYFFLYHIKLRVDIWLNPWEDPSGRGYQIIQSLISIGSGSFFGSGLNIGKPDIIPVATTDFIFSAISEEFGMLVSVAIIVMYMIFAYIGIEISMAAKSKFNSILAFGITMLIVMQAFIIIAGTVKLIPLTGITLPFISYGGSSLVVSFILLGILQAISKQNDRVDL